MITKISESMAYFFAKKGFFEKEYVECYIYGFYYIISETLYWLLVTLIAFLTNRVIESIIYMFVFINIRHCAGGYHANTRAKCNIIFTITYLMVLTILHFTPVNFYTAIIFSIETVSAAILLILAPITPENRKCTDAEWKKFRKKVIIYSLLFVAVACICGIMQYEFVQKTGLCIALAMFSAALSVFIMIFKKGGKKK